MEKIKNIGLGTASIGRPLYINVRDKQNENKEFSLAEFQQKGLQVLEDAYHMGVRFYDTSPGYGLAEKLLIQWLETKNDTNIHVATKWGYTYVANFNPNAKQHEIKEHTIGKLNEQWEYSKTLLPYLKIYQIHSATLETGVLDNQAILQRLHQLKKQHNISIGLTTTGVNQTEILKKGMSVVIDNEPLFQSYQCTFNILEQSVFDCFETINNSAATFIIKEVLANGRLIPTSKYPDYFLLYDYLMALADKYKVGADAIAMKYCMKKFPNAIVLSGADNNIHLMANLRANQSFLNKEEVEKLDAFRVTANAYWQQRKSLQWN